HGARVEELLAGLADQRRRIEEERAALLAELEDAEADRAALRVHKARTLARYEKQTRSAHGEALAALKAARREIDELRRDVKARTAAAEAAPPTMEDVKAATRRLVTPGATVARHEPQRQMPPGTPARPEQLVAGAPVIVPRLGRVEVVSLLPDDRIEVRVGAMRATVPVKDVLLDSHRMARRNERPDRGDRGDRGERGDGPDRDDRRAHGDPGALSSNGVQLVDGVP